MPVAAGSELPVCEGNKMREICACPCWIVVLAMCEAGSDSQNIYMDW